MSGSVVVATVTAIAGGIGKLLSGWLNAYETSKKYNFELEKLRAQHDLQSKAYTLALKKYEAEERRFKECCQLVREWLKRTDISIREMSEARKLLARESERVLNDILRDDITDAKRKEMIDLWTRIQDRVTATFANMNQAIFAIPQASKTLLNGATVPSLGVANISQIEG